MSERKQVLKRKSYQTYQSKFRLFNKFLEQNNYANFDITAINNSIIIKFFKELIKKGLDRTTVNNYKINISAFFNNIIDQKIITKNPVHNIPKAPKTKDEAPLPILPNDLQELLTRIQEKDTQLYLACLMEYFCAVRPGNELRQLQFQS